MAGEYPKSSGIESERFYKIPARIPSVGSSSNSGPVAPDPNPNAPGNSAQAPPQAPGTPSDAEGVRQTYLWLKRFETAIPEPERDQYKSVISNVTAVLLVLFDTKQFEEQAKEVRRKLEEETVATDDVRAKLLNAKQNLSKTLVDLARSGTLSAARIDPQETSNRDAPNTRFQHLESDEDQNQTRVETPASPTSPTQSLAPAITAHPAPAQPADSSSSSTPNPTPSSTQPLATNLPRFHSFQFGELIANWPVGAVRNQPGNTLGLQIHEQTNPVFTASNPAANHSSASAGTQQQTSKSGGTNTQTTLVEPRQSGQVSTEVGTTLDGSSSPAPDSSISSIEPGQNEQLSTEGSSATKLSSTSEASETQPSTSEASEAQPSTSTGTEAQPSSIDSTQTNQGSIEAIAIADTPSTSAGTEAQPSSIESTQIDHPGTEASAAIGASSASAATDSQLISNESTQTSESFTEVSNTADTPSASAGTVNQPGKPAIGSPPAGSSKGKEKAMDPPAYGFHEEAPAYESLKESFDHTKHLDDNKVHILLGASGSVATIKIPVLIRELAKLSPTAPPCSIRVIITDPAAGFLAGQADEQPDYDDLARLPCVDGVYTNNDEWDIPWVRGNKILHIELRRWADIMVVAPLSANTLAKVVGGMSDNLLLSTIRAWDVFGNFDARHFIEFRGQTIFFGNRSPDLSKLLTENGAVTEDDADAEKKTKSRDLASQMDGLAIEESPGMEKKAKAYGRKRILVAPAMNPAMWNHPVTKKHMNVLKDEWGVDVEDGWIEVLGPINKIVACGDSGTGAMMEAKDIANRIWKLVTPR